MHSIKTTVFGHPAIQSSSAVGAKGTKKQKERMKTCYQMVKVAGAAIAALALASSSLYAGPGPEQVYRPVKDREALSALKPGTYVAHECPKCGTIGVTKASKDKSQAEGFTCPTCKMHYTFRDAGGGKAKAGYIACVDDKGKQMSAKVCAGH